VNAEPYILHKLRAIGCRPTVARVSILKIINSAGAGGISAEDIHRQLIRDGMRTGVSTVYRILHEIEDSGLLIRDWGKGRHRARYQFKPLDVDSIRLTFINAGSAYSVGLDTWNLKHLLLTELLKLGVDPTGRHLLIQIEPA
jgi:Fe2+ or Zn2+ uptake regulation protein